MPNCKINQVQKQLPSSGEKETMLFLNQKINLARLVCQLIPASCPFAQDLFLFGQTLHIPPMCKINPFYGTLMNLRGQALTFLADVGGKNI